jgi:hypothetical protein
MYGGVNGGGRNNAEDMITQRGHSSPDYVLLLSLSSHLSLTHLVNLPSTQIWLMDVD